MSQSPTAKKRKDRPDKRKKPSSSPGCLPASQKLKDNDQNKIGLLSTEALVDLFNYNCSRMDEGGVDSTGLFMSVEPLTSSFLYRTDNHLAFPKYLFPLISQKRHFRDTFQSIEITLYFDESPKELRFIADCIDQFALLPRLKTLKLFFRGLYFQASDAQFSYFFQLVCQSTSSQRTHACTQSDYDQLPIVTSLPSSELVIPVFEHFASENLQPFRSLEILTIEPFATANPIAFSQHFYSLFLSKTTTLRSIRLVR